jgi:hypothetical protein
MHPPAVPSPCIFLILLLFLFSFSFNVLIRTTLRINSAGVQLNLSFITFQSSEHGAMFTRPD